MNSKKHKFVTKYPSPSPEPEVRPQYFEKEAPIDNREIHTKLLQLPFIILKRKIRVFKPALTISRILVELDGRDKMMKMTQYFIKILLHYNIVFTKHWSLVTNQLSMTRKLLRIGNVFHSYYRITDETPLSIYDTFILCNTIINQISDDIFCFYKLDLVNSYWGLRAELLASYCWLTNSVLDIWKNKNTSKSYRAELTREHSDDEINRLKEDIFLNNILLVKLFMDAIFCVCDIWKPSFSPVLQSWSGFISSTMSVIKLWIKNSN
ncbi:hypothetical protein K501DRAFT_168616 [Backusella circina FSU 941]|nr:hypothetical protein K501DRAFT_168616 [Backusella circina FSU 941]